MKLPLLVSLPHAGIKIPKEVKEYCILAPEEIIADGDEGACEIYALQREVSAFITTDIARAIVDVNRSEDDRRPDGVVKTHTIWNVPVYREFPSESLIEQLISYYYRPYHSQLVELSKRDVILGVDCHTMAAVAPPIEADAGRKRPPVCLSNADGTCPPGWMNKLVKCFERSFGMSISVNNPFRGGHIIRTHAAELPWVQVELSRGPFMRNADKHGCVRDALYTWFTQVS